jgi:hypothetical protein
MFGTVFRRFISFIGKTKPEDLPMSWQGPVRTAAEAEEAAVSYCPSCGLSFADAAMRWRLKQDANAIYSLQNPKVRLALIK